MENYLGIVEAVLFASGDPVSVEKFSQLLEIKKVEMNTILQQCQEEYNQNSSGLKMVKLDDAYQLVTKNEFSTYIKKAIEIKRNTPLSPASMEVLSIIAYNPKISKSYIEQIRGVDSSSIVNSLVEKGLVEEAGRLEVPGKPIAYKTTQNFLRCFNISSLSQLPPIPDNANQMGFDEIITSNQTNE